MDRVFLDANVLFSAAWRPGAGLLRLWSLQDVTLLSSVYAVEEARRNLAIHRPARLEALEELLARVGIVSQPAPSLDLPEARNLPAKDRPILEAAVLARATHLLTGDVRDFGALMGTRVAGVLVLLPRDYLAGIRRAFVEPPADVAEWGTTLVRRHGQYGRGVPDINTYVSMGADTVPTEIDIVPWLEMELNELK